MLWSHLGRPPGEFFYRWPMREDWGVKGDRAIFHLIFVVVTFKTVAGRCQGDLNFSVGCDVT